MNQRQGNGLGGGVVTVNKSVKRAYCKKERESSLWHKQEIRLTGRRRLTTREEPLLSYKTVSGMKTSRWLLWANDTNQEDHRDDTEAPVPSPDE